MRRARLLFVSAGCGVLLLAGGLEFGYLSQWRPYQERLFELERRQAEAQRRVQQGLIMEAQLPEFRKEVEKTAQKLEALDRILPRAQSMGRPVEGLRKEAEGWGVVLETRGGSDTIEWDLGIVRVVQRLSVCGQGGAVQVDFLEDLCDRAPITWIEDVERTGGCTHVVISTFARRWEPRTVGFKACDGAPQPLPRWLLPPFRSWLQKEQARLDDACRECERLAEISEQVELFQRDRQELERRVAVINEIARRGRDQAWCAPSDSTSVVLTEVGVVAVRP